MDTRFDMTGGDGPLSKDRLPALARSLAMEAAAGMAYSQLVGGGTPTILLKGPAIAGWLYADEVRVSRDIDLLVSPDDFLVAQAALGRMGYVTPLARAADCEIGPNSQLLFSAGGLCIDLHHRLIGVPGTDDRCWAVLARHTTPYVLNSGTEVTVLDLPARAMHLALHVAQSGTADEKALNDLRRGLARLDADGWQAAAAVAAELGATAAFAAGLRLDPAGSALAADLGLPHEHSVELELRTSSAPQEALFFARMADIPGAGAKAAVVARKIWPTSTYLRAYDVVGDGRRGILRAHGRRVVSLARRVTPAVTGWWRARARLHRSG